MCPTRILKAVSALLIAAACLFPNAAPGANHPKPSPVYPPNAARMVNKSIGTGYRQSHENHMMRRKNEARVLSKTKAKNMPSRIQLTPRVIVQSAPTGKTARKPLPVTSAKRMATTQVTPTKLSKIKNAVPRRYIRPGYHLPK